jgi:hypothetical protein
MPEFSRYQVWKSLARFGASGSMEFGAHAIHRLVKVRASVC